MFQAAPAPWTSVNEVLVTCGGIVFRLGVPAQGVPTSWVQGRQIGAQGVVSALCIPVPGPGFAPPVADGRNA